MGEDTSSTGYKGSSGGSALSGLPDVSERLDLFLSCTRSVESVLIEEVEALGGEDIHETIAGVLCRGTLATAYSLCLNSRTASRVYLRIAEGEVGDEGEGKKIASFTASLPWKTHFSERQTFAVSASASKTGIKSSDYLALKIKDGIADSFRADTGKRPSVDTKNPDIRIYGRLEGSHLMLYIDLSGESLHKRGYRIKKNEAPLRETSAAAMLLKAGWAEICREGGLCVDPMCGSGTLAIEAGLIAADIAPGLFREHFGFQSWKGHDEKLWESVRGEAFERRNKGFKTFREAKAGDDARRVRIYASDKDPEAVEITRSNVGRTGLDFLIETGVHDFADISRDFLGFGVEHKGLIAVNPPYGVRMEDTDKVRRLYERFGRWLSFEAEGFRAAVLTAGKKEARYIGLRAEKVPVFYNGSLKGALALFNVNEENTFRPYTIENSGDRTKGAISVVNRIRKNRRRLKNYLKRGGISCYRIYDADIPQYAAAVDVYEDTWFVVQEYAAPKVIEEDKAKQRFEEIIDAVAESYETAREWVYAKQRKRQKGNAQYRKRSGEGQMHIIREGGLKFYVNFRDYLDTGIFLDHRITRNRLREGAKGKKVLNLFAYTCTASVYAVDGGADKVVSVDTNAGYLEWGKRNHELNSQDISTLSFVCKDVMEFLREGDSISYDLIFIDPPTFSNRKDASEDFIVQDDHEELILRASEVLAPEGKIVFSTNYRKFSLSDTIQNRFRVEETSEETVPKDFEHKGRIHRSWIIRR